MVYFQHPEETGVCWGWRIMIIIALEFLELSLFMIPADVLNAGPPDGGIPIEYIWYVIYYGMIVFTLVILPFSLCWFNQDDDNKIGKRILFSILFALAFFVVMAVFCFIFYLIFGVAEIPVNYQVADIELEENVNILETLKSKEIETEEEDSLLTFRISPVLFLIAGFSTIGYILVLIFGGLGFGALPVDLIFSFIRKPAPLKDAQVKQYKKLIGEKALKLIDEGNNIKNLKGRKYRKKYEKFRQDVYILDKALTTLNKRADMKGFLWGYVSLILGIGASVLTLLWIAQMVIWTILKIFPLIDWLMSWMTGSLSFFGAIFYAIFAVYLFACSFKAVTYVGFRFALGFLFYPMEVNNTYMNAFCFNAILLSFIAFGVNQFSSETFTNFTAGTSIQLLLGESITELRYIKYIYKYAPFIMPVLCVLMIIFMLLSKLFCKNQKEKDPLEMFLEEENVSTK